MKARSLIGISVGAHLAMAGAWFVSSTWRLDRLSADYKGLGAIAVSLPHEEAAGGAKLDQKVDKFVKKQVAKGPTQPAKQPDPEKVVATADPSETTGTGGGIGPGHGTDPAAIGTCQGDNCGTDETAKTPEPPTPPPKPPATQIVPPTMFAGLRISGDTQVHPSELTKQALIRDGRDRIVGSVKVCLDAQGSVASASMQGTTKFAEYDATLLSAVRDWRYRPYMLGSQPVPVCSVVTFIYNIK
ncbi:MAG TPA: energy transducer TonB [Kofleriaceae bacterium]|jgi:protein TonB